MTDAANDKISPEQVQLATVKYQLKQSLNNYFQSFVNQIVNIPFHVAAKSHALQYLDTCLLWLLHGIDTAPINIESINPPAQAVLQPQPAVAQGVDTPVDPQPPKAA